VRGRLRGGCRSGACLRQQPRAVAGQVSQPGRCMACHPSRGTDSGHTFPHVTRTLRSGEGFPSWRIANVSAGHLSHTDVAAWRQPPVDPVTHHRHSSDGLAERRSDPWSRRTGAPQATATGRGAQLLRGPARGPSGRPVDGRAPQRQHRRGGLHGGAHRRVRLRRLRAQQVRGARRAEPLRRGRGLCLPARHGHPGLRGREPHPTRGGCAHLGGDQAPPPRRGGPGGAARHRPAPVPHLVSQMSC
jgi:hypothetical protein